MRNGCSGFALVLAIAVTSGAACSVEDGGLLPAGGTGASARGGAGGGGGTGVNADGGTSSAAGVPCDVAALLANRCVSCHGVVPAAGAPMSLVSYADLIAPAPSNPAITVATLALTRMQSATAPMPPAPAARATAAEIAALQTWNTAGDPATSCGTGVSDPFSVPPTCTSHTTWTGGTRGSPSMNPGLACVACHATTGGEAPLFALAGTVYPTAHEPDLCNGVSGAAAGAQVVIAGADGRTITLAPNAAGNFTYEGAVALPFQAKVVYMGRERVMTTPQSSGDCNACHTQSGASGAPGRILLP